MLRLNYMLLSHSIWVIIKSISQISLYTDYIIGNNNTHGINWALSSEFVSSSIQSWQSLTAHAQPLRGARDLAFCLKVPLDSLPVWASSKGSGETARMRRLAWTFAARTGDKYQIRLTRSNWWQFFRPLIWSSCSEITVEPSKKPSKNRIFVFL